MCALLWVVVAVGGVLLDPTGASGEYSQMAPQYRAGVDVALQQLESHATVQHHFIFFRSVLKSDNESGFGARYVFHHFLLKPTRCAKGTSAQATCPHRNDRPMMDCMVCYKMFRGEMETEPKPYVHCIQKPKLTQEMSAARNNHCRNMSYQTGSAITLAVGNGPT